MTTTISSVFDSKKKEVKSQPECSVKHTGVDDVKESWGVWNRSGDKGP